MCVPSIYINYEDCQGLVLDTSMGLWIALELHFFCSDPLFDLMPCGWQMYCQTSNIRPTLEGNKIVDLSDVVGASPVGAAPTTSSFST